MMLIVGITIGLVVSFLAGVFAGFFLAEDIWARFENPHREVR